MSYDKSFFKSRRALTAASSRIILGLLWDATQPKSVLDVGCATGIWLSVCKQLGAERVLGIDGSWVPRDELEIDAAEFLAHDLEASIPESIENHDVALCIELAEHLPPESARGLIDFLTTQSTTVLFSAAIPGQGGEGHVNEQRQSYWHGLFAESGFLCFDLIRPRIWNDSEVNVIYKQNMLLYTRTGSALSKTLPDVDCSQPTSEFETDRVHPELFQRRSKRGKRKKGGRERRSLLKRLWASMIDG
jgi:SAM-dependent methyltransferase